MWLRVDRLLGEYQIPKDSVAGRRHLAEVMKQRRFAKDGEEFRTVRRGWFFGSDTLKQELLTLASEKTGQWHYGEVVQESAEAKAERIVQQELVRRKWDETSLALRRKGDKEKLAIARRLRQQTTMTVAWIAKRLKMGTKTHLAHLLYWSGREKKRSS